MKISNIVQSENNINIAFQTKLSYTLDFHSKIVLSLGVNNIFNQYQNDFDIGKERDAGYIYGPIRPRTGYFEISTKI